MTSRSLAGGFSVSTMPRMGFRVRLVIADVSIRFHSDYGRHREEQPGIDKPRTNTQRMHVRGVKKTPVRCRGGLSTGSTATGHHMVRFGPCFTPCTRH
jgi:hypothetical protein